MKKYTVQVVTGVLAVSFLWGILGGILMALYTKAIGGVVLLTVVGAAATWLFIYRTFITKEA